MTGLSIMEAVQRRLYPTALVAICLLLPIAPAGATDRILFCALHNDAYSSGVQLIKYRVDGLSLINLSDRENAEALGLDYFLPPMTIIRNDEYGLIAILPSTWRSPDGKRQAAATQTFQLEKRSGVFVSILEQVESGTVGAPVLEHGTCTF